MPKPDITYIPAFYQNYVHLVREEDLTKALKNSAKAAEELFYSIPEDQWSFRYAPEKWSISDMLQHLVDAERIFCYRALCFARKDATPLPGFDENDYAAVAGADQRTKSDLMEEFAAVRKATVLLFSSFTDEQVNATGVANQHEISVSAIGFVIAGHLWHHMNVVRERYLPAMEAKV
ncbi:MAG: DinB family protein [Flavisolibacter sp.]